MIIIIFIIMMMITIIKDEKNNNSNINKLLVLIIIIIITRCYVKANSFVQFLCPKFALTYVEFALTSSRYSYGINPIVGIRLNVEYMACNN